MLRAPAFISSSLARFPPRSSLSSRTTIVAPPARPRRGLAAPPPKLDAAKTRIQASTDPAVRSQGVLSALRALARERALYRGFAPVLVRALPVHMAYLPVYDFVMARL